MTAAQRDDPPLIRFTLAARSGQVWSYPYSYVGLVELPSADQLVIHCNSREVEAIDIQGRGLDHVAKLLAVQRLVSLSESDHAAYAREAVCITSITVRYAEKGAGRL